MTAQVSHADWAMFCKNGTDATTMAMMIARNHTKKNTIVLAKGADLVAKKIREIARKNRVPVIENRPVARALYAQVKVGQMVPENLFQTVAEILAYVYRLKKA